MNLNNINNQNWLQLAKYKIPKLLFYNIAFASKIVFY